VLGKQALGFRTPHFGSFQSESQLKFLYSVLRRMGYRYSTSTMPIRAYRLGSVHKASGLTEIPLAGSFQRPLELQDSWGYYGDPVNAWGGADYLKQTQDLTEYCRSEKMVGHINFYAEPSVIRTEPTFFEALSVLRRVVQPVVLGEMHA